MASTVNIKIDQGSKFEWTFELQQTHLILEGADVRAALKREYFTNDTPILFTSDLDGANLTISLTSTQTANLTAGTWVYDVIVVDASNSVTRAVQGLARVSPRVTLWP